MMPTSTPINESDRLPFITGSVAYGTPTDESDVDLVALTDKFTMALLLRYLESDWDEYAGVPNLLSLCFGRLNLLLTTEPKDYDIWRQGTEELKERAPVMRDEAVAHFAKLRGET